MNKTEIRKLVLDAYHREGDQISQRIDWSLIFHAILFEAYVAASNDFYIQVTIGTLGLIVSYLWLVIGARQNWLMRHLIEALKSDGEPDDMIFLFFEKLSAIRQESVPRLYGWIRATPVFSIVIPATVCAAWIIALLHCLLHSSASWAWFLSLFFVLVVVTFFSKGLTNRPRIEEKVRRSSFLEAHDDEERG